MRGIVLTFSKCIKHVPGKKSSIGDKPALRRKEGPLDVGRMALVRGCGNVQEFRTQRQTVSLSQSLPSRHALMPVLGDGARGRIA